MTMKCDLHVHTTASDGRLAPADVVRLAGKLGLSVLAITDHDSMDGIQQALDEAQNTSLLVVPGVEINTDIPQGEVHVLGYCVDYHGGELRDMLKKLCQERLERGQKMVARLATHGMPVKWDRVLELAGGGVIGRPHIARAMLEAGYIQSLGEAFQKYLSRGSPTYVEREKVPPVEAVKMINRSGGFAVLAHPHSFGLQRLDEVLQPLISVGLAGIETYYNGFGPFDAEPLVAVADEKGLLACGGSDYHAFGTENETPLGSIHIPRKRLQKFLDRAQKHMPGLFKTWTLTASQ